MNWETGLNYQNRTDQERTNEWAGQLANTAQMRIQWKFCWNANLFQVLWLFSRIQIVIGMHRCTTKTTN